MIRIRIVILGRSRHALDSKILKSWNSKIFQIIDVQTVSNLPNANGRYGEYLDGQISDIIQSSNDIDIVVGITSLPIEDNFYMRKIRNDAIVLSLYEVGEIILESGNKIEQFVIRGIYTSCLIYQSKIFQDNNYKEISHYQPRGCLFDMNINKSDILESMHQPELCSECSARYSRKQLPENYLNIFNKEIHNIKKPVFERMRSWVKVHPIITLVITTCAAVITNLLASFIYDVLKNVFKG